MFEFQYLIHEDLASTIVEKVVPPPHTKLQKVKRERLVASCPHGGTVGGEGLCMPPSGDDGPPRSCR